MDSVTFGGPMDRVLLLRTAPLFEGLGPVQLAAIAQHATERFLPRDSLISPAAGKGDSIFIVVEGELCAGQTPQSLRYGKGDAAGLIEALGGIGRSLALRASVDTMLLELDWDTQLDVCEEHFAVIMAFIAYLSARLIARTQELPDPELGPVPLIAAQQFSQPLDLNERLLLLSRSGAFSSGSLDALAELAQQAEEIRLEPGARVWSVGQDADYFLLIASGALHLQDRAGGSAIYRAGTAAGMAEALSPFYRRFSAVSPEPTVALRIQIEAFLDILEDHFDLSLDVMATLAGRLLALEAPASASR